MAARYPPPESRRTEAESGVASTLPDRSEQSCSHSFRVAGKRTGRLRRYHSCQFRGRLRSVVPAGDSRSTRVARTAEPPDVAAWQTIFSTQRLTDKALAGRDPWIRTTRDGHPTPLPRMAPRHLHRTVTHPPPHTAHRLRLRMAHRRLHPTAPRRPPHTAHRLRTALRRIRPTLPRLRMAPRLRLR